MFFTFYQKQNLSFIFLKCVFCLVNGIPNGRNIAPRRKIWENGLGPVHKSIGSVEIPPRVQKLYKTGHVEESQRSKPYPKFVGYAWEFRQNIVLVRRRNSFSALHSFKNCVGQSFTKDQSFPCLNVVLNMRNVVCFRGAWLLVYPSKKFPVLAVVLVLSYPSPFTALALDMYYYLGLFS